MLTRDHTVLPATHTFIHEWNEPSCLYSQPQSITALWPVLITRPTESRRLSWPVWLVTYRGFMPGWRRSFHLSANRPILRRPGIKLTTTESQVRRRNHSTTEPPCKGNSLPAALREAVCNWTVSNRNSKRISAGNDKQHPATLWRFSDFGAVMQVSRLTCLLIHVARMGYQDHLYNSTARRPGPWTRGNVYRPYSPACKVIGNKTT